MKLPNWIEKFGSTEPEMTDTEESFLRGWREWAFRILALLIVTATVVGLAESFHGLYEWFVTHGSGGNWGYIAPVAVDFFTVIGELAIFTALTGHWHWKKRILPWIAVFLGFGASVAGNVGRVAANHPLPWDLTALVFPLAAAFGILIGFSVLKSLAKEKSDVALQKRLTLKAEVIGTDSFGNTYVPVTNEDIRALPDPSKFTGLDALIPPNALENKPEIDIEEIAERAVPQTEWLGIDPNDKFKERQADLHMKLTNTGQFPVVQ